MNEPIFGKEVLFNAALWIANRLPIQEQRLHKIFKILWFADLYHLKKYGRTISGDTYYAMRKGPVPTYLYDVAKTPGSRSYTIERIDSTGLVAFDKKENQDYLSETDLEALEYSLAMCKDLSHDELTEKSHQLAWKSTAPDRPISIDKILDEIDADEDLREYVHEDLAIRQSLA